MLVNKISTILKYDDNGLNLFVLVRNHLEELAKKNILKNYDYETFKNEYYNNVTIKDKLNFLVLFGTFSNLFKLEYSTYINKYGEHYQFTLSLPIYE